MKEDTVKVELVEKITGEKQEVVLINEEILRDKIYVIRGQKVMLDADLAEIYGYTTKNFNRQVKNNTSKFEGEDFMFSLTEEEWKGLRCKNFTSSWGGTRYLPLAFTEQGIYMLMTVLRGELATKQSRALIRTFKQMKDYIVSTQNLISEREYLQLSMQIADNIRTTSTLRSDLCKVEKQMAAAMQVRLHTSGGVFHDRYIILDYGTGKEKIFQCGASSKDAGARVTSILEDQDRGKYQSMIAGLLQNPALTL